MRQPQVLTKCLMTCIVVMLLTNTIILKIIKTLWLLSHRLFISLLGRSTVLL